LFQSFENGDEIAWTVKLSSGIRPMTFDTNADGSTKRIFVQLSNFHGFIVVDMATGESRFFLVRPNMGIASARCRVEEVDSAAGRSYIESSRRVIEAQ